MRRLIILSAAALASISPARAAHAQTTARPQPVALRGLDDVKPGTKLRVVTSAVPPERLAGRFVAVSSTALSLQLGGSQRRDVDISRLLRVDEAYRDRKRGALVGALPGIVLVYAWDFFGPHPRYADQSQRYRENVIGLAVTCGGGALLGAAIGWERWRPLQTSAR